MKKAKRVLCIIIAVLNIILSCNILQVLSSYAASSYKINSPEALSGLNAFIIKSSNTSPVTINITADIDASSLTSFSSINTAKVVYVFGNNHVISNLSMTGKGLFESVGAGSTFSNLGLYNCSITNLSAGDGGYGLLVGTMTTGSITGCFADGEITLYGTGEMVGGLVGVTNGTITSSFSICDIKTNLKKVGGLLGEYSGSENANAITNCYSTGDIENATRNYIGGLIGYSAVNCVSNCYTTTFIKNAYADTVKAIGCVTDMSSNVYYDKTISLQRQGDLDANGKTPAELSTALSSWVNNTGYYPQLSTFSGSSSNIFKAISAISAARADLNLGTSFANGTGREFMKPSTTAGYTSATLTTGGIMSWKISGGIDEYYFDPSVTPAPAHGSRQDGLSGNTYDSDTGKYLFVNTGDVRFTATSSGYERSITVNVRNDNPYIASGDGTQANPFAIANATELDYVRMYCLVDSYLVDSYYYKITEATSSDYLFDLSSFAYWSPIVGFKGNFDGGMRSIKALTVSDTSSSYTDSVGLFATVSGAASITRIHLPSVNISTTKSAVSGLVGTVSTTATVTISSILVSGTVIGNNNVGMLIGNIAASGNTSISECLTMGQCTASVSSAGGLVGLASSGTITNCYSTAVVEGKTAAGGLTGLGAATIENSLFTGMLKNYTGNKAGITCGTGTITNCYYDRSSASEFTVNKGALPTIEIAPSNTTNKIELIAKIGNTYWYFINTNNRYPQIKSFQSITINPVVLRASYLSSLPITYTYSVGNASSTAFTNATVLSSVSISGTSYPITTSASDSAYSVTGGTRWTFTKAAGGARMLSLTFSGDGNNLDTRYIFFNVRSANVYVRYVAAAGTNYTNYMNGKGLVTITTENGHNFNSIVNLAANGNYSVIGISPSSDAVILDAFMPLGAYTYEVAVYTDQTEATSITVTNNTVPIPSSGDVYIKITVTSATTMPDWGKYNINCS